MTKGIYCYIDNENNEIVYVGRDSHIDTNERHKAHFYPSKYNQQVINRILQKNPDRYTYQRLWEINDCTDNHLNEMEKYYTKIYNPKFSFTEGGEGTTGYKHSEESRKKMSESRKGKTSWKKGKTLSEETIKKMSEAKNTTGFYRVSKYKDSSCKQGFIWVYKYFDNNKRKTISSIDLKKLEEKVRKEGLEWIIISKENSIKSIQENNNRS